MVADDDGDKKEETSQSASDAGVGLFPNEYQTRDETMHTLCKSASLHQHMNANVGTRLGKNHKKNNSS